MCLGIPAKIVSITSQEKELAMVDIANNQREVNISCIIDPGTEAAEYIGAWVLVHVGFAMSRIDEKEAHTTLALLEQLGELQQEIHAMSQGDA